MVPVVLLVMSHSSYKHGAATSASLHTDSQGGCLFVSSSRPPRYSKNQQRQSTAVDPTSQIVEGQSSTLAKSVRQGATAAVAAALLVAAVRCNNEEEEIR